ncbi:citrate (Si)-synthase, partial [Rhizobium giardinii]
MSNNNALVSIEDERVNLSMRSGTMGPTVIDIGSLYTQTGRFTYDPGFTSTASC